MRPARALAHRRAALGPLELTLTLTLTPTLTVTLTLTLSRSERNEADFCDGMYRASCKWRVCATLCI